MDLNNYNPPSPNFQDYLGGNPIGGSQSSQGTKKSSGLGALGSIGAGIDIASGLMGALDSVFGWSAKRQQRYQKELMDKQQSQWKEQQSILAQQQLDQWNRENEYNDPTNYFKRLMAGADANGLSKAAVLGDMPGGSVGQSATGVTAPGSTSAPGVGGSTLLPFGSSNVLGTMRQRAETSLIEAQADYYENLAGVAKEDAALRRFEQATEIQLANNYAGSFYAHKMAGNLAKVQADNIELMQPFEIDKTVSESAYYFEQSLKNHEENKWISPRYSMDMLNGLSLIMFRAAATEAEIELARERNFNNQLWEQTLDARVQYMIDESTVMGYEADTFKGTMWWNRVNQTLGNVLDLVSMGTSFFGMSVAKQAMTMKNATKRVLVEDYKTYPNGRSVRTGGSRTTTTYDAK